MERIESHFQDYPGNGIGANAFSTRWDGEASAWPTMWPGVMDGWRKVETQTLLDFRAWFCRGIPVRLSSLSSFEKAHNVFHFDLGSWSSQRPGVWRISRSSVGLWQRPCVRWWCGRATKEREYGFAHGRRAEAKDWDPCCGIEGKGGRLATNRPLWLRCRANGPTGMASSYLCPMPPGPN